MKPSGVQICTFCVYPPPPVAVIPDGTQGMRGPSLPGSPETDTGYNGSTGPADPIPYCAPPPNQMSNCQPATSQQSCSAIGQFH